MMYDGERPGYVRPCQLRRRPVTSLLTSEEHAQLSERARARGLKATPLATQILRDFLAKPDPSLVSDNFEDSPAVYAEEEEVKL